MIPSRHLPLVCLLLVGACRPQPPDILAFGASPTQVGIGGSSILSWKVRGATRLTLRNPAGGADEELPPSDGQLEVLPTVSGAWVLTAHRNEATRTATASISVGGAPRILNFAATPALVAPGQRTTLSWATEATGAVSISDGAQALSLDAGRTTGELDVYPAATTTYVLSAFGNGGLTTTQALTVEVPGKPQVISFVASPASINPNQPVTLAWAVSGASEVSIKKDSSGAELALGSQAKLSQGLFEIRPGRSESYTLTALGVGGNATAGVSVAVQPVIGLFEANPPGVDPGEPFRLSWTTFSAVRLRLLKDGSEVLLDTTDPASLDAGGFDQPAPGQVPSAAYELEITSREGVRISKFVTVGVGPKPQVDSFSVKPSAITTGGTFTLAWRTAGATSLVIKINGATATTLTSATRLADGSWDSPAQPTAGPVTVELIARSAVLSQEARSALVQVYPPPGVTAFTATPAALVNGGDSTTLDWTAAASSAVLLAGSAPFLPALLPGGSVAVRPLTSARFTLRAYNAAGDFAQKSQEVTVGSPSTAFSISPSPFVPGEELTVSWDITSQGASSPRLAPPPYLMLPETLVDISTTGTSLALPSADDALATLAFPPGFSFDLGPGLTPASAAVVSSNGFLTLSSEWSSPSPSNLAADDLAAPPLLVAPLWDDLRLPAPEVHWQLLDPDTLAVQWTGAQFRTGTTTASGSATFQAVLHRDGTIDFRYGSLTSPSGDPARAQGGSATVAVSGPRQSWASELGYNTPRLAAVTTVRFLSGPVPLAGSGKLRPPRSPEVSLTAVDGAGAPLIAQSRANAVSPGAVLINEVLPIPAAGVDPQLGQWLELRNASNGLVDLSALVLASGSFSFVIPAGTTLAPGALLVLGRTADATVNGGVPVAIAWGSALELSGGSGEVSLFLRGVTLGSLSWGGSSPTAAAGTSLRRDQVATFGSAAPLSAMTCLDATPTPGAFNGGCSYEWVATNSPIVDLSGTGQNLTPPGNTSGDWRVQLDFASLSPGAPAFSFPFFGTAYSAADLSSNGWLSLYSGASSGNTSSAPTPKPLPAPSLPNAVIAPFWDDLSTSKSSTGAPPAKLLAELRDPDNDPTTANRVLYLEWSHFDLPATTQDADLTFQALLHETTGEIELRWGDLTPGNAGPRALGSQASAGIEDAAGQIGIPVATPLSPSTGIRFTRPP